MEWAFIHVCVYRERCSMLTVVNFNLQLLPWHRPLPWILGHQRHPKGNKHRLLSFSSFTFLLHYVSSISFLNRVHYRGQTSENTSFLASVKIKALLTLLPLAPGAPAAPWGPEGPRGPGKPGAPATPAAPCRGKHTSTTRSTSCCSARNQSLRLRHRLLWQCFAQLFVPEKGIQILNSDMLMKYMCWERYSQDFPLVRWLHQFQGFPERRKEIFQTRGPEDFGGMTKMPLHHHWLYPVLTEGPAGPAGPGLPGSPRDPAGPSDPRAPWGPASPFGESGKRRTVR